MHEEADPVVEIFVERQGRLAAEGRVPEHQRAIGIQHQRTGRSGERRRIQLDGPGVEVDGLPLRKAPTERGGPV